MSDSKRFFSCSQVTGQQVDCGSAHLGWAGPGTQFQGGVPVCSTCVYVGPMPQGPQGPEESSFLGRSQDLEGKATRTSIFKALTHVMPAHIPMAKESHAAEPSTAEREGCTLSSGGRGQWVFAEQCTPARHRATDLGAACLPSLSSFVGQMTVSVELGGQWKPGYRKRLQAS